MEQNLSPDTHRIILEVAARENLPYAVAHELLISEGFKAMAAACPGRFENVHKPVNKPLYKPVRENVHI